MRCIFCQNHEISTEGKGFPVTIERLAQIFLEQQARNAHCLELVTPTHYVLQIIEALKLAKKQGLSIPVVYNTSGYERVEGIDNGKIDVVDQSAQTVDHLHRKRIIIAQDGGVIEFDSYS